MSHRHTTWRIHGGGDSDGESEEEEVVENLTPPKGVSESFCQCVDTLKWGIFRATVLGPELNTPEAQQNRLLESYETLLEHLYAFLHDALKGSVKESVLTVFPHGIRHSILTCAQTIQQDTRTLRYTDRIPYHDYLNTQLRIYPYLQHRGKDLEEDEA